MITLLYIIVVGLISTLILDLWGLLLQKVYGVGGTDWGVVGQWLRQVPNGRIFYNAEKAPAVTSDDQRAGWIFHYAVGIFYAFLLVLIGGYDFIGAPSFFPFLFVGFILSSLAGLFVLIPCLGGGLCGLQTPRPGQTIGLILLAHLIFMLGQYLAASLF